MASPGPTPPGAKRRAWLQRFLAGPGWVFHAVVAAGLAAVLVSATVPGTLYDPAVFGCGTLVCCGVAWTVRLVLSTFSHRGPSRTFYVAPAVVVLVAALVLAAVPLRIRWLGSRSAFEAALPRLDRLSRAGDIPDQGHLGGFRIVGGHAVPGGFVLTEVHQGLELEEAGFAHLRHGPPPATDGGPYEQYTWTHLGGGWYAYSREF